MKKILAVLVTLVIVLSSSMAFAAVENDAFDMVMDTFVFRPLGFGMLVGGSAIFIVSLPIAAITNSVDRTAEVLVKEPFRYTFVRPVGDVDKGL